MHLTAKHLDAEAHRIAKLRGDLLIVPRAGRRFIDWPEADLRWLGALLFLVTGLSTASVLVCWMVP
jgi:hypothetical protein